MSLLGRYTTPEKASEIKRLANLSFLLAKKHYGGVHLIGDKRGIELLRHLDWSSVSDELEELPEGFRDVWSLSKLKAYNIIAQKNEPFFHIDFDFFLLKRLPNEIETANVVFQSRETRLNSDLNYNTDVFHRDIKYLPVRRDRTNSGLDIKPRVVAYNCGIVGGTDIGFFKLYSELAIKCVLSQENRSFWQDTELKPISKPILAEQYYASLIAHNNYPSEYVQFLKYKPPCWEVNILKPFIHLLAGKKSLITDLEAAIHASVDFKDISEEIYRLS